MGEPLTGHPAIDGVTAKVLVVEQDRPVVSRSTWLTDAAVTAARTSRSLQLVTPERSRLTYPLELLLGETGAQWVVRAGGRFRDGLTALPLHWDKGSYVPQPGADPLPPLAPDHVWAGSVEIQITSLHPATGTLSLGATAEAAMRALVGREPAGWGIAEPVTQPWSRREVTAHCRGRAPAPSSLVIVAGDTVGVLAVRRVKTGVLEEVRLSGPLLHSVGESALENLADEVSRTARSMIVAVHHGRSDGLRSGMPSLPPLPYAILAAGTGTGPEPPVSGRGLRGGARWYRLDDGPLAPYELLTGVLQHYGLPVGGAR